MMIKITHPTKQAGRSPLLQEIFAEMKRLGRIGRDSWRHFTGLAPTRYGRYVLLISYT